MHLAHRQLNTVKINSGGRTGVAQLATAQLGTANTIKDNNTIDLLLKQ